MVIDYGQYEQKNQLLNLLLKKFRQMDNMATMRKLIAVTMSTTLALTLVLKRASTIYLI